MLYSSIRWLCGVLLRLFYRQVGAAGLGRLAGDGPTLIVANHQNSLIDPMLLLQFSPRRLHPIARAPLFRHPILGPFLKFAGAIPVHRRQDPDFDPRKNELTFRTCRGLLGRGAALVIFPEGFSQPDPRLMPLKTGAARIYFGAEEQAEFQLNLRILPVGLVYENPETFRRGRAFLRVGEEIRVKHAAVRYREDPVLAVQELTDEIAIALRDLIHEVETREELELLRTVQTIWIEQRGAPASGADEYLLTRRFVEGYHRVRQCEPDRLGRLRRRVESYVRALDRLGISGERIPARLRVGSVLRYLGGEGLLLLVGLPLGLWGMANHYLPYRLCDWVASRWAPVPDQIATYKLVSGTILYPVFWGIQIGLVAYLGNSWIALVYALLLVPSGIWALRLYDRGETVLRRVRALYLLVGRAGLTAHLRALRRSIYEEVRELAERMETAEGPRARAEESRPSAHGEW